jgi:dihydrofolate reductase
VRTVVKTNTRGDDMPAPRVRVYIATSIDGYIAGPDDDLSWLPEADATTEEPGGATEVDPGALDYEDFIAGVGALLMGRRTYDVVRGFDVPWPYGDRSVLVATTRQLDADPPATVRAVAGPISELVEKAKEAAGEADVYLDGGTMIRQAAELDLIDDLTITIAPIALGAGISLFGGMTRRYPLESLSHSGFAWGMVQIRARPDRRS